LIQLAVILSTDLIREDNLMMNSLRIGGIGSAGLAWIDSHGVVV
jgi:hypothetical protein